MKLKQELNRMFVYDYKRFVKLSKVFDHSLFIDIKK